MTAASSEPLSGQSEAVRQTQHDDRLMDRGHDEHVENRGCLG